MRNMYTFSISILFVYIFCLAGIHVQAQAPASCDDSIVISSLPYTISEDDTCYCLTASITGTGNGITVQSGVNNVRVNGGGDTVFFGTTDANSQFGLKILGDGATTDLWFQNISFIHNPDDSTSDSTYTFIMQGGLRVLFDTVNFHCVGHKTAASANVNHALWNGPDGNATFYGYEFNSGTWSQHSVGFNSRGANDGMTAELDGGSLPGLYDVSDTAWHYIINNVNIVGSGGVGVKGRSEIKYCSIYVAQRNDRYTYPSGDSYHGFANQAGIGWGFPPVTAGSRFHHNYIIGLDSLMGLDEGFVCQYTAGTEAAPVEVCSNYVSVHCGLDPNYGYGLFAKAYKQRFGNRHLWTYDNTFYSTAGDTTKSWMGKAAIAAMWSHGSGDGGPDSACTFERNLCRTFIEGVNGTGSANVDFIRALQIGPTDLSEADVRWDTLDMIVRNNYIITNGQAYELGGSDGFATGVFTACDTIEFDTAISGYDFILARIPNTYSKDQLNNYFQDVYYVDEEPDNIFELWVGDYEREVWLERTCSVLVIDQNEDPTEGVIVVFLDNYFPGTKTDTLAVDTSNAAGWVSSVLRHRYEADDATDSLTYNPFKFIGSPISGAPDSTTFTVDWDSYVDTLQITSAGFPTVKVLKVRLRKVEF